MNVGSLCSREVFTADLRESVEDIAKRMADLNTGSLVVLDADQKPVGIVTDRDLVIKVLATGTDPVGTCALDVITENPETIQADAAVEDALRVMREKTCRRLPVVDEDHALVGVVTLDDIMSHMAEELEMVGGLLKKQNLPPAELGL